MAVALKRSTGMSGILECRWGDCTNLFDSNVRYIRRKARRNSQREVARIIKDELS